MQFTSTIVATLFAVTAFASPLKVRQNDQSPIYPGLFVPLRQDQPETAFGNQPTAFISQQDNQSKITTLTSFNLDPNYNTCSLSFKVSQGEGQLYSFTGTQSFAVYPSSGFSYSDVTWNTQPQPATQSYGVIQINTQGESNQLSFPCQHPYNELLLTPADDNNVDIWWTELDNPTVGLVLTQST
ncbi:hypothetical protein NEOLI_004874 [Neolecta irregularis DAH-3]|uniref:Ubiquitin 3 binding protein But2 C-terminal domain-containing protein n=1 Tax=Neolecta irregularis (strain DAH-3) TaxID=1198029 RepID=A0A1U7LNS4_NEOID|nr:hypothetical protein NEOLI_004874 [Neolecta irregularis DAH-3]|eukprot:OLL24304.1 hypothetical protein NEOLI_004874 [Neolecta irregularis DAH-3]